MYRLVVRFVNLTKMEKGYDKTVSKELRKRDKVICRLTDGTKEKGILLFHKGCREYMVFFTYSMWYGNNEYDYNSYGKAYLMKGLKAEDLELIGSYLGKE